MPPRRINWLRDEIILACALVEENGWRGLDERDPRVLDLSGPLRASHLHPSADRFPAFRNAAGVALKTANVATAHPAYTGVRTRGNRLDGVVVADFLAKPERMHAAAGEIRRLLQDGESDAALGPGEPEVAEVPQDALLLSVHLRRESSPRPRNQKVASGRQTGFPAASGACCFNVRTFCQECGDGCIEVRSEHGRIRR